jgi:hypothetical protein
MPVLNDNLGAAVAAAAIIIQGTCPASVKSMPEKPAASSCVAISALFFQVSPPVIRSNSTFHLSSLFS